MFMMHTPNYHHFKDNPIIRSVLPKSNLTDEDKGVFVS